LGLARGNLGERLAADSLARDGHHILTYKPDIAGTNQPGIDIVTIRHGVVHLVDNKALTRSGNVAPVSALTTNFTKNLASLRAQFAALATDMSRSASERQVFQQALTALNSGNFVRVVTSANLTRDTQSLTGVTQQLASQGIRFLNVF
jgi:Holliday junction resolvase-like predicted endonuclease